MMSSPFRPVSHGIDPGQNAHFSRLREAYRAVGDRTWSDQDFQERNLEISRSLFVPQSLHARKPRPKALEVYALVSGLPFAKYFTDKLVSAQMQISEILANRQHYWVEPQNLGVEYCVFKWPTDSWNEGQLGAIKEALTAMITPLFKFHVCGVQINPDGCVVARGYDENAQMFRVRASLKAGISPLPERQSCWAHVPLGRILEPLGVERFEQLRQLISKISDLPLATTEIGTMKLIHETRWYMEERETLGEYPLVSSSRKGGK
jgi:hypothetical protein